MTTTTRNRKPPATRRQTRAGSAPDPERMTRDQLYTAAIAALARTRGPYGFTDAEADEASAWAWETFVSYVLLKGVLAGAVALDVRPGAGVVVSMPACKEAA